MNRRDYLKVLAVAVPAAGLSGAEALTGSMEMHIDFAVEYGEISEY